MKLRDLGVRPRLLVGFGVLLVVLGLELTFTYVWFKRLDSLREALADDVGPRAKAAGRLERAVLYRGVSLRSYGLTRDPKYLQAQAAALEEAQAALDDLNALARRPEGRVIVGEMKPVAQEHAAATDRLLALLKSNAGPEPIAAAELDVASQREKLFGLARQFSAYQQRKLEALNASVAAAQRTMSWGLPCLGLLILATFVATAYLVTHAVADPVRDLLAAARGLANGDYRRALALDPGADASLPEPAGAHENELRELAEAFAHAAARLQQREAALAADVQLSGIFATRLAVNELADNALRAIAVLARAELGAVYVLDDTRSNLQRAASFPVDVHAPTLAMGEGIPGQAALQRSPIHIRDIPSDTPFRVRLGIDDLPPRAVLAVPVLLRGRVHGVIVLASLREFTEEGARFVQHAANLLAPSLANAVAHREVVRMRAALQQKNEQLNCRNEELQLQREEIQAQNEELQAQNEELQAQRDELHARGEQLREAILAAERAQRRNDEFLAILGHEPGEAGPRDDGAQAFEAHPLGAAGSPAAEDGLGASGAAAPPATGK